MIGRRSPFRAGLMPSIVWAIVVLAAAARPVSAQVIKDSLPETEGVMVKQKIGAQVPMDLRFTDSFGDEVRLGDMFDGKRPVLLILGYYDCPLLCDLIFTSVTDGIEEIGLDVGKDYRVLAVSFDHTNTRQQAQEKREFYATLYQRKTPKDAWVFCTSEPGAVRDLATAVGYRYRFLPEQGEFSHPAAIMFLTPEGKVASYMEGVKFPSRDLQLALMDAGTGKIGTAFEQFFFTCFHYDPNAGAWSVNAKRVMKLGGLLTMLALMTCIGSLVLTNTLRRRSTGESSRQASNDTGLQS